MDNLNLTNFIAKYSLKRVQVSTPKTPTTQSSGTFTAQTSAGSSASSSAATSSASPAPQMASLANTEQSVYIKGLLNLPKNLNEFVYMVQRGYTQMQMSRLLMQQSMLQRANMSQTQAQILAQLQGLSTEELQNALQAQLASGAKTATDAKNLQILSNGMINLSELATLLQNNGKDAITKLILTMANASKQGMTDVSRLKDTAKLINASISLASQENTNQTLKTLLLLYLPWLPLQEGTDFDVEFQKGADGDDEDSILVITISTVNFGKVVATLILETSNSVHLNVECSKDFPKDELLARLQRDERQYSMQSVVTFSGLEGKSDADGVTKASVTMSQMKEINPFMLLAAHSVIRNTIMIDNEASGGIVSHVD